MTDVATTTDRPLTVRLNDGEPIHISVETLERLAGGNPDARFPIPEVYAEYIDAPEIERIAKRLIAEHDDFALLRTGGFIAVEIFKPPPAAEIDEA